MTATHDLFLIAHILLIRIIPNAFPNERTSLRIFPEMMQHTLAEHGFEIHRGVLTASHIAQFREEADAVASAAQSACVRHLRARSVLFQELSQSTMVHQLIPRDMRPVRSILFDKTVEENWPVAWHQDLTIAVSAQHPVPGYGPWSLKEGIPHVQPPLSLLENMVTLRFHLDDTPATNGALQVIPGSHRHGRISADDTARYLTGEVVCECRAGDVLVMSPLLLHASRRSAAPKRRRILHIEYARHADLSPALQWAEAVV
jgi:ectoine hydroxylase-related dioxygenase (phytanoyl-CoA dioxygenase family)